MNSYDIPATTICQSVSFEYERNYGLETQWRQSCDLADKLVVPTSPFENTFVQGTQ